MVEITSCTGRVRSPPREPPPNAAAELLVEPGFPALRTIDVAGGGVAGRRFVTEIVANTSQ